MNFGGPVWHASIHKRDGKNHERELLPIAMRVLAGVGDKGSGQWIEFTGEFFHLRRRCNAEEEAITGGVLDLRGTDEWQRRFDAVKSDVPAHRLRAFTLFAQQEKLP